MRCLNETNVRAENVTCANLENASGHYSIQFCHYKVLDRTHAPQRSPYTVDERFIQCITILLTA